VRSLEELEETHPEFAHELRRPMHRLRGKEYLRLGRELLVRGEDLPGARAALRRAVTFRPGRLRGWLYLAFASIPGGPRAVASFRRRELAVRRRLSVGPLAAAFRDVKSRLRGTGA